MEVDEKANQPSMDCSHDAHMHLPNPMVGFDLPNYRSLLTVNIMIPKQHNGPVFSTMKMWPELPNVYGRPLQDPSM